MDNTSWQGTNSSLELTCVVILYILHKMQIGDWAGAATIAAALSTIALNLYRAYSLKQKKNYERDRSKDGTP